MLKLASVFVTLLTVCTTWAADRPQYWDGGFKAVYTQLQKNVKPPTKKDPFWHAHPAPKYPGVYLWDSAFISLIWKHKNPAIAEDVIQAVILNQQPDGRIPHVVQLTGISKWTQPPLLAWAADDILKLTQDVKFASAIYPKLRAYHVWLWKNRRFQNGLFFWQHPYESGIDNSPRFGNRDESHYYDTTKIGAVDFTSYMVMDCRALKSIAQLLVDKDPNADKAKLQTDIVALQQQADETSAAINNLLWDEQSGYYYDLDMTTGKLNHIATVASFFPLTAHAASEHQFLKLREHAVNDKEFNRPFPFPTVSESDPTFEKDMWRGPVWINTSFLAIRGMKEYGDQPLVEYFSEHLVDSVYKVWSYRKTFFEFYDPDRYDFVQITRKEGLGPVFVGNIRLSASHNPIEVLSHLIMKQLWLGTKPVQHFIGWTGLVNTLAIEELNYYPPGA